MDSMQPVESAVGIAERLRALHGLDRAVLSTGSLEEIARLAAAQVERLLPCDHASVLLFEADEGVARVYAAGAKPVRGTTIPLEALRGAERLRHGEILRGGLDDGSRPFGDLLAAAGLRSFVAVPLSDADELYGCLLVATRAPDGLGATAAETLRPLASAVAVGIRHLRQRSALEEAERGYRSLFENVPVGLYRSSPDGRILDVNAALVELLGYPDRETLLSVDVTHLYFSPEDRTRWREAIEREGVVRAQETRNRRFDGSPVWVREHARVVRDDSGAVLYYEGAIEDITARRRAEEALRESEIRYRSLVDHNPNIVYGLDLEGRFTLVNPAGERIGGYAETELLGRSFLSIVVAEHADRARDIFARALGGEPQTYELGVQAKNGSRLEVRGVSIPIVVRGEVVGVFGMAENVTEQRSLEEALRQAQKMEAIGRLAGGIAHDFNNILTGIRGHAQLALSEAEGDSPLREDLVEIERSADRAAALTRQLLAFSRRQMLQPEILDVNRVVADMEGMLRRLIPEDVDLVTVLGPDVGTAEADPVQLQQVLLNLALNARDAMPGGGRIVIWTQNLDVTRREAARLGPDMEAGRWVVLAVEDTGVGMDEEVKHRMFEPFFTTKGEGKGTGLGLSMVYGIVKQSGGVILVDSERGAGTTFQIYLPRRDAAVPDSTPRVSSRPEAGTETVLLVEDEATVRRLAKRVLERHGYTVLEAANPRTALKLASEGEEIDIVLTDVVMPHMSGPELHDALREERPGLRVVYMSGYAADRLGEHGVLARDIAFLEKPFTPQQLVGKIREVLDGPSA